MGGAPPPGNVDPVYDYDRNNDQFGGTVVTGGYVYRGPDPSLQGKYFFLDSRNSPSTADDNYWMFDPADPFGTVMNIDSLLAVQHRHSPFPVSFGEDAAGNLYIAYLLSGDVYRINTRVAGRLQQRRRRGRRPTMMYGEPRLAYTPRGGPLARRWKWQQRRRRRRLRAMAEESQHVAFHGAAVPEPATLIFAAVTLLCIALKRR